MAAGVTDVADAADAVDAAVDVDDECESLCDRGLVPSPLRPLGGVLPERGV